MNLGVPLLGFTLLASAAAAGWQTPGDIQTPKGTWQVPGEFQVPGNIRGVKAQREGKCIDRVTMTSDALFDFDKSDLRSDAEAMLAALGPEIAKVGQRRIVINGHTDSIGSDSYNDRLSETRAGRVRDWLTAHGFLPAATATKGYGERRPVAANTNPDGSDSPVGRQKNRRVEIDIDLCG